MSDLVAEFRKTASYWRLVWGLRTIGLAPFVFVTFMIVDSVSEGLNGAFAWILFLYLVGSFAWFVPGLRGLLNFLDEKGLNDGELSRLVQVRRGIWFAAVRKALFMGDPGRAH